MLWGITTYFNPVGWRNKRENYRVFRRRFPLPLLTVEMSADGRFELGPGDAEILLQFAAETSIWQKEAAINVAVRHLPDECDRVAWVDADLIWDSPDWHLALAAALDRHPLVQPFADCVRLPRGGAVDQFLGRPDLPAGRLEGERQVGFAAWVACVGAERARQQYRGHVGFAWGARRELIESVGLYPYHVLGGGDTVIAYASLSARPHWRLTESSRFGRDIDRWRVLWYPRVQGDIGHVPGTVYHLWHGDMRDRGYRIRHALLDAHGYDPAADVRHDANGLLAWTDGRLLAEVEAHFHSRHEDAA